MATQKTKTKRTNYAATTKREKEAPKRRNNAGARFLCVVLALIIIVSAALMIMQFCTPYKPSNGFKPADNQTTITPPVGDENKVAASDDGGMLATQEPQEGAAKFLMARIAPEDFEEYGISEQAESAVTLTITNIQPETAIHRTADWAAKWESGGFSWVEGGGNNPSAPDVYDYVEVTPSADTLSATVVCLQAFGTPIELSATFQTGNNVKVAIQLDYIARLDPNSEITLTGTETDANTISFGERRAGLHGYGEYYTPRYTVDTSSVYFGVGTIVPEIDETRDAMGVQNGTYIEINLIVTGSNKYDEWLFECLQPVKVTGVLIADAIMIKWFLTEPYASAASNVNDLLSYIERHSDDAFKITYTFNVKYDGQVLSTETLTNTFAADVSRLTNVSSAEMDKDGVMF